MKDERIYHGAMDKSKSEWQIRDSALVFCIGRKNWPYPPTASGAYAREGGRPADEMQVGFEILKFSTG